MENPVIFVRIGMLKHDVNMQKMLILTHYAHAM